MNALQKLLRTAKSSWLTYAALLIGFLLLFLAIQLYIDANALLNTSQQKKDGYDYLVVNKRITNDMMGDNAKSSFTLEEIEKLKQQKAIEQTGLITSNEYGITANTLGQLAFSTQLFFESVPDEYLDIAPETWQWKEGDKTVPVILSADYLNLYNFGFAFSQGLPQMSEESIKAIPFNVTIYDATHEEHFVANVVGLTQRYSSVLVPADFMNYANAHYGVNKANVISRIILKTKEADNPDLVRYLAGNNYATQNEKLKTSKLKSIMNIVFETCGLVGLFVLVLSCMLLMMYLKLIIVESANKLTLLGILGYKPSVLQKQFTQKTLRSFFKMLLIAVLVACFAQIILFIYFKKYALIISPWPSWQMLVVAVLIAIGVSCILRKSALKIIEQTM